MLVEMGHNGTDSGGNGPQRYYDSLTRSHEATRMMTMLFTFSFFFLFEKHDVVHLCWPSYEQP